MKSNLTTNANELIKRVQFELSTPFSEKCTLFFSVFPSLGTDHFSIQVIEEDLPFLISRQWKGMEGTTYPLGVHIFDLNNIRIKEQKIGLSKSDCALISEIKTMEIRTEKLNGIMLDGEYFKLIIGEREYDWNMTHQISLELQKLLDKLMKLTAIKY